MAYFTIAERLGMNVRALLNTTDSRELAEWLVYLNADYWRERLAEELMTDDERSSALRSMLGGRG